MHTLRRRFTTPRVMNSIRSFGVGSNHTTFAVALDVDGVLYRGGEMVPGADEVLRLLHKRSIPHILLTNGGGHTESWRAEKMNERFGVDHLTENHIQLAHTPMRDLLQEPSNFPVPAVNNTSTTASPTNDSSDSTKDEVEKDAKKLDATLENSIILSVGKANADHVVRSYGFKNVLTVQELHALYPHAFPDISPEQTAEEVIASNPVARSLYEDSANNKIAAVFCIMDPLLWSRELQLVSDVVRSNGQMGTLANPLPFTSSSMTEPEGPQKPVTVSQPVKLFLSCPDLEYVNEWQIPRYGAGTFGMCLEHLYSKVEGPGAQLQYTIFGKPNKAHYDYASVLLEQQAKDYGHSGVHAFYGIGDNPKSDVAGANGAGEKWSSIMTCTGMYTGGADSNDPDIPADTVVETVKEAITYILAKECLPDTQPAKEGAA